MDQCLSCETNEENILRSTDIYYAMGVIRKRKYIKVRQSLSFKKVKSKFKKTKHIKVAKCFIAALVPYYTLVKFLEGADISNLHSVEEHLCGDGLAKINGFLHDLKYFLPRLAEFKSLQTR